MFPCLWKRADMCRPNALRHKTDEPPSRLACGSASPTKGEERKDPNGVEQKQTEVLDAGLCAQIESKAKGHQQCGDKQAEQGRLPFMHYGSPH